MSDRVARKNFKLRATYLLPAPRAPDPMPGNHGSIVNIVIDFHVLCRWYFYNGRQKASSRDALMYHVIGLKQKTLLGRRQKVSWVSRSTGKSTSSIDKNVDSKVFIGIPLLESF